MGANQENTELFTDKSNSYAKYRSSYPAEMIDRIVEPFKTQSTINAADIGAGTGISSRLLGDAGVKVTAVEPNRAMAEAADEHTNVEYIIAPAESTGLESNSYDLVTSFQAFHWFHFDESLKEFNRLLKPDGKLALVWSYWDESDDFTGKFNSLINKASSKFEEKVTPYDGFPSGYIKKWRIRLLWKLGWLPYFSSVEKLRFSYDQNLPKSDIIGYAKSQSFIKHEGELWSELCEGLETLAKSVDNDTITLKYRVTLFLCNPK
ncbi:class I SAM-dependent methyltransferase [Gracilimonas tropica]|uniref:class I SAM-dependent methyltransferase n=1 Tax=Gracilimonas tropica TaxID=454600 RepID=UPI00036F1077|nr:class I SAM-dependent methyltransferase [Gracilimonas tropica]